MNSKSSLIWSSFDPSFFFVWNEKSAIFVKIVFLNLSFYHKLFEFKSRENQNSTYI